MWAKFRMWTLTKMKIPVRCRHFYIFGKSIFEVSPQLSVLFIGSAKEHSHYFVRKGSLLVFSRDDFGKSQELLEEDALIFQHSD